MQTSIVLILVFIIIGVNSVFADNPTNSVGIMPTNGTCPQFYYLSQSSTLCQPQTLSPACPPNRANSPIYFTCSGITVNSNLCPPQYIFRNNQCILHLQTTKSYDESPLKQFKSGTPVNNVKCNLGLALVVKTEDGSPACVEVDTANVLIERGWALNSTNLADKESLSLLAYQGASIETFYNNGTVASNFTINVNINNFRLSNASLVLQVYYNDGVLYKTINVSSDMIQPDGFYKYQLIAVSDKNHPPPFKVIATYNNQTVVAYAPVFAHP